MSAGFSVMACTLSIKWSSAYFIFRVFYFSLDLYCLFLLWLLTWSNCHVTTRDVRRQWQPILRRVERRDRLILPFCYSTTPSIMYILLFLETILGEISTWPTGIIRDLFIEHPTHPSIMNYLPSFMETVYRWELRVISSICALNMEGHVWHSLCIICIAYDMQVNIPCITPHIIIHDLNSYIVSTAKTALNTNV